MTWAVSITPALPTNALLATAASLLP